MIGPIAAAFVAASAAAIGTSAGEPPVRFHCIDGRVTAARWAGVSGGMFHFRLDDGLHEVPAEDLMQVEFAEPSSAHRVRALGRGEVVCALADDGVIRGSLQASAEGAVRLRTELLGELVFPLADLRCLRFGDVAETPAFRRELDKWEAERSVGTDVLLAVRDAKVTALRGALLGVGPDGGRFEIGQRVMTFRPGSVYAVVLSGRPTRTSTASPATILLREGSRLPVRIDQGDTDSIDATVASGRSVRIRVADVVRIDGRTDRLVFLDALTPSQAATASPAPWPPRVNRSVANTPLRVGGVEYSRGVGVHSRTELAYDVKGQYRQFAATIGIDDRVRPRGHVVFRVLADGREVFNSGPVTGTDAPQPILVDVSGASQVRLIVEVGEQLDLADQADWANARFLR